MSAGTAAGLSAASAPGAVGAGTVPLVPADLAATVASTLSALDPLVPWALLAVLLLAGVLLAQHRRLRASAGAARPGGAAQPRGPDLVRWALPPALLWGALAWGVQGERAEWVTRADADAARWAQAVATPALHALAVCLSDVGDVPALSILTLIVTAWLWRRHQRWLAAAWLLSIVANSLAVRVLKNLFERARPEQAATLVTSGYSFPSGHAAGALMVYGLLAWVLCDQLGRRWRRWIVGTAALLIAGIAASRVLLGVHYFSDVLGGLLWSASALLLTIGLIQRERGA